MPTPARRAISSSDAATPCSAKANAATSINLSRLRRASARMPLPSGKGLVCFARACVWTFKREIPANPDLEPFQGLKSRGRVPTLETEAPPFVSEAASNCYPTETRDATDLCAFAAGSARAALRRLGSRDGPGAGDCRISAGVPATQQQ